jgi:NAD(P)-dependent dehydrogenase (short-subunit alcohol dehydrogenase family)
LTTVGIATGAGRGMGLACARRMAPLVDRLLLVDLDEATAKAAAAELDGEPFVLDVTDREGLARLADRVAEIGTLRAVAHAAGISPTMADWRRVFEVDLVGTARLVDALRPLATADTAIVCFASMAPHLAFRDQQPDVDPILDAPLAPDLLDRLRAAVGEGVEDSGFAYAYAKRGVQRLVRREAIALGPLGARICSVSPGIIQTPMGAQELANTPFMEVLAKETPLGRQGEADELASVVAFLLSDDARFVTGTDVLVDGGVVAAMEFRP